MSRTLRWYLLIVPLCLGAACFAPQPFSGLALYVLMFLSIMVIIWREKLLPRLIHLLTRRGSQIPDARLQFSSADHRSVSVLALFSIMALLTAAANLIYTAAVTAPTLVQPETPYTIMPHLALGMIIIGGILLTLAVFRARRQGILPPIMLIGAYPTAVQRIGWRAFLTGLVLLAFVTLYSAGVLAPYFPQGVSWRLQEVMFITSLILIAYGAGGTPRLRFPRIAFSEWLIFIAICALALVLRAWGLDTTLRLLLDEQNFIDMLGFAIDLPTVGIIQRMSEATPYTWLFTLVQADVYWLLGADLTALRLPSALWGVAQVAAIYALARTMFDRRTAVMAGVALAVLAPHLHYGRTIYSPHPGDALFGILTFVFMTRALRGNRALDWSIAGVCLGLTQYFYEAGRLFFPPLTILWLITLALWGRTENGIPIRRLFWREMRGGLARWAVCAVIVGAPVYITLIARAEETSFRLAREGMNWSEVLADGFTDAEFRDAVDRLARPFWFYIFMPENSARYYGGTEPLILRPLTPLFLLGVFYLLARPRSPAFILLLWVAAAAASNALFIRENIWTPRYTVVVPALALIVAVGVRYAAVLLFPTAESSTARVLTRRLLPITVIAFFAVLNIAYYFGPHLDHLSYYYRRWLTFGDAFDATLRAVDLPTNDVRIVFIGLPAPPVIEYHRFWEYLEGRIQLHRPLELEPAMIDPRWFNTLSQDTNYALFIETQWTEVINLIYRYLPRAQPPQFTTTPMAPDEQYILIYVPAA